MCIKFLLDFDSMDSITSWTAPSTSLPNAKVLGCTNNLHDVLVFTGYETLRTHGLHLIGGPPALEPPHVAVTLVRTELIDGVSVSAEARLDDVSASHCPCSSAASRRRPADHHLLRAAGAEQLGSPDGEQRAHRTARRATPARGERISRCSSLSLRRKTKVSS
jgi:hypothetical protein